MAALQTALVITKPDDWHHHLRDGAALATTVPFAARQFGRAICMPNLVPPVTTTALALAYRERILAQRPAGSEFTPLMTLYLTDFTTREEIRAAKATGLVFACKLYPAGATTNSHLGVTAIEKVYDALDEMATVGLVLCVHSEATDPSIDIFDREAVFVEQTLRPLVARFPTLKIVMEHCTTRQGAEFVASAPANVVASVTCHHLLYNRNALFVRGIRPHMYCMPILKAEEHRRALLALVTSGSGKFFLGTDSAPHEVQSKHSGCGCAGVFTAHAALELYAEAFDSAGKLEHFEAFASHNGPDFYGLPRSDRKVKLTRDAWLPPASYDFAGGSLVPLRANEAVNWTLADA